MTPWIGAILLIIGFVLLLRSLGLVSKSAGVFVIARRSFEVIRSSELSDEAKEATLQRNSKQLLQLFFVLVFLGAVAALLPVGVLWVCDRLGWVSLV